MADTIVIEVARYSPETDAEPHFQKYEVPLRGDWMVLDALNYIKDRLDGSLTYRWSCRMGICGSCGMVVNGVRAADLRDPARAVRAGAGASRAAAPFPDRARPRDRHDRLHREADRVKPWIMRKDKMPPPREYIQTPEQLATFKQYSNCINCMLCYSACPVYGIDPHFIGPAALALAERYNLDSRDQGASERLDILSQHDGIWDCTVIGECSVVCPKEVDPSLAIQEFKLTATKEWYKSFLMPWGGK